MLLTRHTAWIIAAFLPLPVRPQLSKEATPSQVDVERAMQMAVGPTEEKSYLKARWWRNLNRIMAVFGAGLIAAIVCLCLGCSENPACSGWR